MVIIRSKWINLKNVLQNQGIKSISAGVCTEESYAIDLSKYWLYDSSIIVFVCGILRMKGGAACFPKTTAF